jgi:Predicted dinucleotide-utilizing enzyme
MIKKKIAIIGTGSIGTTIADEISNQLNEYYELVGMMKNSTSRIKELEATYKVPVVTEFSKLLDTKPNFIIEAAGVEVVEEHGEAILKQGIHFILIGWRTSRS